VILILNFSFLKLFLIVLIMEFTAVLLFIAVYLFGVFEFDFEYFSAPCLAGRCLAKSAFLKEFCWLVD